MKNKYILILVLSLIVVLLTIFSSPSISLWLWKYRNKPKQQALATELGVKIKDYPYPDYFPNGYFGIVLKPGMSYEQVHNIVRGYSDVVNCWGTNELYNYFGVDDNDAIRYLIRYSKEGKFEDVQTDFPGDRTLGADETCSEGVLDK
jgi:hypothetical protein